MTALASASVDDKWKVVQVEAPQPVPHFACDRKINLRLTEFDSVQRLQHKITGELALLPELEQPDKWTLFNQDGWGVLKSNTAENIFASQLLSMSLFCDTDGDFYIEKKETGSAEITTMFQGAAKA